MGRVENYILYLLIFLFPSQLAYHYWHPNSNIFGIRVDYLAGTIYFTDVLIVLLLMVSIIKSRFKIKKYLKNLSLKNKLEGVFLVMFAFLNTIFSISGLVSLFFWLKAGLFFLFFLYLTKIRKKDYLTLTSKALKASLIFFGIIGLIQFLGGKTLGGLTYFLGERSFNTSTPGISLLTIFGKDFLKPYSTFPHPNSMAGFYLVSFLIILFLNTTNEKVKTLFLGTFVLLIFILTNSTSLYLTFPILLFYFLFSKRFNLNILKTLTVTLLILTSMVFMFIVNTSTITKLYEEKLPTEISERIQLTRKSTSIIRNNLIIGSGAGTFILNPKEQLPEVYSREILQPVHNVYLLVFSETGLAGLFIVYFLLVMLLDKSFKEKNIYLMLALIVIMFTGLMDHYWFTLQQNKLIFTLLSAMLFSQ